MKPFTSKTTSFGGSLYLLIPAEQVQEHNIKEGEFYSAELYPLVPAKEVHDDPRD